MAKNFLGVNNFLLNLYQKNFHLTKVFQIISITSLCVNCWWDLGASIISVIHNNLEKYYKFKEFWNLETLKTNL